MKTLFTVVVVVCLVNLTNLKGQDLHFAQYTTSPTSLNPAFTGFMNGNLRFNANYRNQWFKQSSFSTYAASVDANIARRNLDYDMLGVGLSFYQDIEEKSGYSNTNISLSAAYNVMLTDRPLQYIGFGIQGGLMRKQINLMDAVYGTFYESGLNADPLGLEQYNTMKFDLSAGLSYYAFFNRKHVVTAGVSVAHITQPNFALGGEDFLYRKYVGYILTELEVGASGLAWLKPSFYFGKQGPSMEIMPKLNVLFQFYNAVNDVYLGVGAGMRMVGNKDSKAISNDFIGEVQLVIESYTIGFSYEVVFSDLKNATSRNGGPEISFIADFNFERRNQPRYFKMMKM